MPIEVSVPIEVFDQDKFHALDRQVMRIVFDVHNDFGRLLAEELYKVEIAARCAAAGIEPAEREVRIRISHDGFVKESAMDLLLRRGYMLEGKAADRLVATHRAQAVNYLHLAGMRHGRLVNFRTGRVEHEYVSTTMTAEDRRRIRVAETGWVDTGCESRRLKATTVELLEDWGAFLDVNLYREGLVHFLGGRERVCRAVPIYSGPRQVGTQDLNLLTETTAFALTARPGGAGAMREHLGRLLANTRLHCLQWVNLNRHAVEFTTLIKQ